MKLNTRITSCDLCINLRKVSSIASLHRLDESYPRSPLVSSRLTLGWQWSKAHTVFFKPVFFLFACGYLPCMFVHCVSAVSVEARRGWCQILWDRSSLQWWTTMLMLGFKPTSSGSPLNCWGSLQPWSSQCTSAFKDSNRYNLLNTHSLATQAQALELGFLKPAAATPFMTLVTGFTLIKPSERSLERMNLGDCCWYN